MIEEEKQILAEAVRQLQRVGYLVVFHHFNFSGVYSGGFDEGEYWVWEEGGGLKRTKTYPQMDKILSLPLSEEDIAARISQTCEAWHNPSNAWSWLEENLPTKWRLEFREKKFQSHKKFQSLQDEVAAISQALVENEYRCLVRPAQGEGMEDYITILHSHGPSEDGLIRRIAMAATGRLWCSGGVKGKLSVGVGSES